MSQDVVTHVFSVIDSVKYPSCRYDMTFDEMNVFQTLFSREPKIYDGLFNAIAAAYKYGFARGRACERNRAKQARQGGK